MSQTQCPNCGAAVHSRFKTAKMMNCESCGTSLYLLDEQFVLAGEQGVMHEGALIFALGDHLRLNKQDYHLIGHARFSYGRGWWDEFWAEDGAGEGAWVSVDEGDIVVQRAVAEADWPKLNSPPSLGGAVRFLKQTYRVTEREQAECVALRGAFPELMEVGERYQFVNCQSEGSELLSGEFWSGGRNWFLGAWVDPFDVDVTVTA